MLGGFEPSGTNFYRAIGGLNEIRVQTVAYREQRYGELRELYFMHSTLVL